MSGQINCPAPLPEDTAGALLTGLLTPAPYKVPEKTKKAKGTRKSSRRQVLSYSSPITLRHTLPPKTRRKKKMLPFQAGETRKGRPPQLGRPKGPRREGLSFRTTPPSPPKAKTSGCLGTSPWRSRKYSDARATHSIPLLHCLF